MVELSRRAFLSAGVVLGAGLVASACGSSSTAPQSSAPSATARRGGTLKVGITGGTSGDTVDPWGGATTGDFPLIDNVFERLARINPAGQPELWLADELTPNSDASVWTVRVKQGVMFHDGRELTAEDILYTFRTILNPSAPQVGAPAFASMDPNGFRVLDKYTAQLTFHRPFSIMLEMLAVPVYSNIVPSGYDIKRPRAIGTGPFKLASFTPGQQANFDRFDGYWVSGRPYLDHVIVYDFSDETSQVNALTSGQVDAVNLLTAPSIPAVQSAGGRLLISDGGGWNPFTMRVDVAPFSDVRVRQAFRYAVDRPEMLKLVFGDYGTVGNDIFGIWAPEYDHDIPQRQQDIGLAKSLLRQAGHQNLAVELVTSNIAQGTVSMATVFAQQLSQIGVTASLKQVTPTDMFGPNYLKWTFAQDFWYYNFYLPQVQFCTLQSSVLNETHFNDPVYQRLYSEAVSTIDASRRTELAHEMQLIDYDRGGLIIPLFPPVIDAYTGEVHGFVPSKSGLSLNDYTFTEVWMS